MLDTPSIRCRVLQCRALTYVRQGSSLPVVVYVCMLGLYPRTPEASTCRPEFRGLNGLVALETVKRGSGTNLYCMNCQPLNMTDSLNGDVRISNSTQQNGFELGGLVCQKETSTSTGMREDVLLLSWLIVLLRTQSDGEASCTWAYRNSRDEKTEDLIWNQLSSRDVIASQEDTIRAATDAISCRIAQITPAYSKTSPVAASLILCVGDQTFSSDKNTEKVRT